MADEHPCENPASNPRTTMRGAVAAACALAVATFCFHAAAARPANLPTVEPADYGRFEQLGRSPAVSADGLWLAYEVERVDRSRELRVRRLDSSNPERTFEQGRSPAFSDDGRWIAWTVAPTEAERKAAEKEKKPALSGAGLARLDAPNDEPRTFDAIREHSFDATGRFLALLGQPPEEPKGKGADLRVLDLEEGAETSFGNVGAFEWSDVGSLLALVLATGEDEGNAVQVYDGRSGRLLALDGSSSRYVSLAWREDTADLAVLRTVAVATDEDEHAATALAWRALDRADGSRPARLELDATQAPAGFEVVEHRAPEWADDGSWIAVGLRPCHPEHGCARDRQEEADEASPEDSRPAGQEDETEAAKEDEEAGTGKKAGKDNEPELPGLQIWHTKDRRLFPQQKNEAENDRKRTLVAIWRPDEKRLVQVGSDLRGDVELPGNGSLALESTDTPYGWGDMFGRPYHDVWTVDTQTGARERVLEHVRYDWTNPQGGWMVFFDGEDFHSLDLASGERVNLTADLARESGIDFADTEYDTPTDQLPPHGVGGWLEDDGGVLVYDRDDVWLLHRDGSDPRRLTDGRATELIHRVVDPRQAAGRAPFGRAREAIDPSEGLFFELRNERSEQRGFAVLDPEALERSSATTARPALLGDHWAGGLMRAEDAPTFVYRIESRSDSPDLFVTGPSLDDGRQVTSTNPFLGEYAWTRSELFDFESEQGRDLQAVLLYPANHDPQRRYPMIVYTYEILAPQMHRFEVPDERDDYDFTVWTEQGYFVLLPDIVYTAREPGPSALAAVRPAVEAVVERGLVDAERVGLIGHSWGGYQAAYLPTRTNLFAASVAGAPLTDFVSFMGQLHWTPGIAELSHWETGQARMEVPFWEDPEAHRRSSPIHEVQNLETPLLMAFGDADGVVDWDQGTEFYNFARRAGKQMVLLVYEGENHGFRDEANQRDYHRRILEWFGHYLKGEDAPAWILEGVAYEDLEAEKKRVAGEGAATSRGPESHAARPLRATSDYN